MADSGSSDDVDIVKISREEAHRVIDNQVQTLNDIDDKAARLLRINLVLLGIILTGISLAVDTGAGSESLQEVSDLYNKYTIGGVVMLLLSTGVAAVTYTSSSLQAGVSANDLRMFLDNDFDDRANLEGLVEGYSEWIEYNYEVNAKNAPLGTLTLLLLIFAMTSLSLGVYRAIAGGPNEVMLAALALLSVVVIYFTGFVGQIRRYLRVKRR